ncbi:MAG: hypothetical protein JWQ89_2728 [Devosia sp.]|uniref:ATP-binding protein n=1 Tax=Devosia sp. TaxID=1871048 RepID=UPI0026398725|nr:ATP-binding protein [Devosia sp.]MDB5541001.1 hypothetical protein [Devosia sp.]
MSTLRLTIAATFGDVDAAAPTLVAEAAKRLSGERLACFEIAIVEALNNIVQHAYRDVPDASIGISIEQLPTALRVLLTDRGAAAPGETFSSASDAAPRAESGRGLSLILGCADELAYRSGPGGNELDLTFRSDAAHGR